MSNVISAIGTTLGVSVTAPSTEDAAGYGALTFVDVADLTTIPAFGPSFAVVEHVPLKDGIVQKSKGALNYGSMSTTGALIDDDAGQLIMLNAVDGTDQYNNLYFELKYNTGAIRYFKGKVFSFQDNPNSVGSNIMVDIAIEINAKPIRVAAV